MDKPTRNLIQKTTQDARHLLETEFSRQLEGVFDILSDGAIAPEPGGHLDPAQKVVRRKIVAAIEHEKASGMSDREAVAAYLREASFTCLNRFTALKIRRRELDSRREDLAPEELLRLPVFVPTIRFCAPSYLPRNCLAPSFVTHILTPTIKRSNFSNQLVSRIAENDKNRFPDDRPFIWDSL